jgi:hypothetical protein
VCVLLRRKTTFPPSFVHFGGAKVTGERGRSLFSACRSELPLIHRSVGSASGAFLSAICGQFIFDGVLTEF